MRAVEVNIGLVYVMELLLLLLILWLLELVGYVHTEPDLWKSVVGRHAKPTGRMVRLLKVESSQVFRWNVRPGKRLRWRGEVAVNGHGVIHWVRLGVQLSIRRYVGNGVRVGVVVGSGHRWSIIIAGRGLRGAGGIVRGRSGVCTCSRNLAVQGLLGKFHVIGQLDIEAKLLHLYLGLYDGRAFR